MDEFTWSVEKDESKQKTTPPPPISSWGSAKQILECACLLIAKQY